MMATAPPFSLEAVWQDLEWGAYDADLALWEELARERRAVLDLGCGGGRVALRLARTGAAVTAVDADGSLVAELGQRAAADDLPVEAVQGDIRTLDLGRRFELILAPMQLLQLLRGAGERREALRRVAAHLADGGLFATALLDLEDEEIDSEYLVPLPDMREYRGWVLSSHATAIRTVEGGRAIVLERRRHAVAPDGRVIDSEPRIRLALVTPDHAEAELRAAGLRPCARRPIPPTEDFMGSVAILAERAP
jgi:SAM-dependent methyltransferase